jgi:hypothetical protein
MDPRKFIAVGTGIGIEIGDTALEVSVVRVRPRGIDVLASTSIRNFRERTAAEWGSEYARFLEEAGASHLAATILIPRREIIARYVMLPGVANRDVRAAIEFQVDTLHPYGELDAVSAWSRVGQGALVGVVHRETLEAYKTLFVEAGIAVAAFTFSAAVLHAARRLPVSPASAPAAGQDGFLALFERPNGTVETYGENVARPLFSAEFDAEPQHAATLAAAELRLAPEMVAVTFEQILPVPRANPVTNDLSQRALPYAAALAGACPWLTPAANLLPAEQRGSNSRARLVPSLVLAGLLVLLVGAGLAYSALADHRYLAMLQSEIHNLEPQSRLAASLDRETAHAQSRTRLLDEFRGRTKADLDVINELTTLLAPPTWTNLIDVSHDSVTLNGETDQAAPLLKLLDASPYFQNSAFVGALTRNAGNEQFQIRATRKAKP